jgi:hypothetical protein
VSALKNKAAELVAAAQASVPPGTPGPSAQQMAAAKKAIETQAWTYGASQAYVVAAIMMAVAALITFAFLNVKHRELAHDGAEPVTVG